VRATQLELHGTILAIDTPVVDSEGSLVFEIGFTGARIPPACETLKPFAAILTEAFLGTPGPSATGVCSTTFKIAKPMFAGELG
jgi:hypothetical protein